MQNRAVSLSLAPHPPCTSAAGPLAERVLLASPVPSGKVWLLSLPALSQCLAPLHPRPHGPERKDSSVESWDMGYRTSLSFTLLVCKMGVITTAS